MEIEHLYREHRAGLVRLVERELRDHHDAEDVVQTAFLDAQRALERGTIPRNPRAWLATIALNAAHRLRRRRVNAEPLEEFAVQEALGVAEIRAALATLPRDQRVAVLYRDVLGLSYGETADQMGTSVNAVTMLLHRGRKGLRESLGVTTAGVGVGRWWRRLGVPQIAAVKGATAVVVAAGLASAGIVAARAVAPVGSYAAAAVAARSGGPAARAARPATGRFALGSAHRRRTMTVGSRPRTAAVSPTAATTAAAAPSPSPRMLGVPTVSLPTVSIPTVTIPATVAVSTPITTVTVPTPQATTATVTTPITTITPPLP